MQTIWQQIEGDVKLSEIPALNNNIRQTIRRARITKLICLASALVTITVIYLLCR